MKKHIISIDQLPFLALFKVSFFVGLSFSIFLGICLLLVSVISPSTVTINGQTATGFSDGLKGLLLCLINGGVASIVVSAMGAGLIRLISKKTSFGSIKY